MSGFFEEVQRRKVYRVAAAHHRGRIHYSDRIGRFPGMGIAELDISFGDRALLIGFPIALILAWAYDVTPQGSRTRRYLRPEPTVAAI
jgi:hypothetical protein